MISPEKRHGQRTVGLLIAAGYGRRFDPTGSLSKLEQAIAGVPVAVHAARALLAGCERVVAAVRAEAGPLGLALEAAGCLLAPVTGPEGMGTSIACAARIALADENVEQVLVLPADMPWVKPATVLTLTALDSPDGSIVLPVYQGQDGHPVRFPARLLPTLARLSGERGARALVQMGPTLRIPVNDDGVVRDVDIPSDLETFRPAAG